MKIIFMCGSLEPGRDGVGDYSQKLADEFKKQGHKVAIIAINDKYTECNKEEINSENKCFLRLSSKFSWKIRMEETRRFIESFKPDYVSLQYVPYSFHSKGLPFILIKHLKKLGKGHSWHIMFHETWVGIKEGSPVSHTVYKFFQKKIAKSLITSLNPKHVSTSNRLYQLVLKEIGIDANILTLFSNISKLSIDNQFIHSIHKQLNIDENRAEECILIGIFGSIYTTKELHHLINNEIEQAAENKKTVHMVIFGRLTNNQNLISLQEKFKNKLRITCLGELSENHVSSILQILTVGLSSTPEEYISKSGVYAAMRLHNVRVIAASSMRIPKYETEIKKFNEYLAQRECYKWNVEYIAKELYENLSLHTQL